MEYLASASRTPFLSKYYKSEDNFQTQSLYKYLIDPSSSFGMFARVQIETAIVDVFDNRAEPEPVPP